MILSEPTPNYKFLKLTWLVDVFAVEPALRLTVSTLGKAASSITQASIHIILIECTNNWSMVCFNKVLLNANGYE